MGRCDGEAARGYPVLSSPSGVLKTSNIDARLTSKHSGRVYLRMKSLYSPSTKRVLHSELASLRERTRPVSLVLRLGLLYFLFCVVVQLLRQR
jgi:hypothetical protein